MNLASPSEMHHILVAHVVNSIVKVSQIKNDYVECELTRFLATLNKLLKDYQKTFNLENKTEMIGSDALRAIIQDTSFKLILHIHEDSVRIDASPHKFQTTLADLLVNSAIRYSEKLTNEVNKLTTEYHGTEESMETLKQSADVPEPPTTEKPLEALLAHPPTHDTTLEPEPKTHNNQENTSEPLALSEHADSRVEVKAEENDAHEDQSVNMDIDNKSDNKDNAETQEETTENVEEQEASQPQVGQAGVSEIVEAVSTSDVDNSRVPQNVLPSGNEESEAYPQDLRDNELEAKSMDLDSALTPLEALEEKSRSMTPELKGADDELETDGLNPRIDEVVREDKSRKRSHSPLTASQKHKRFQNIAINLVKTIEEHRFLSPFLTPVNAKEYEQVIYEPKDLKSILKAVRQKDVPPYETVKDLERDIMLMFANCVMYNKSSTHLVEMARQMKDDVRQTFKMFEDAESEIH